MLADRLTRYSQSLCYDDLSSAVVHEVKRRVLDSLEKSAWQQRFS